MKCLALCLPIALYMTPRPIHPSITALKTRTQLKPDQFCTLSFILYLVHYSVPTNLIQCLLHKASEIENWESAYVSN